MMLRQWQRHDGYVAEVDDDQLAALRRLRAAFGFVEIIEVVSHDPTAASDESIEGARGMEDPRRMTPEEREQAHALLTRAVSDPDWRTARQALDDLMRKLLVVHRLLEARNVSPSGSDGPTGCNGGCGRAVSSDDRSTSAGGFPLGPPGGSRPLLLGGGRALDLGGGQPGSRAPASGRCSFRLRNFRRPIRFACLGPG
jgi:hypothetical protein